MSTGRVMAAALFPLFFLSFCQLPPKDRRGPKKEPREKKGILTKKSNAGIADAYKACLRDCASRHIMEAVAWEVIEGQCKMSCACRDAKIASACPEERLRCAPYHKGRDEKSYRLLCQKGRWIETGGF